MPRIRWPIGTAAHTNAALAAQKLKNPRAEPPTGVETTPARAGSHGASGKKRKIADATGALATPPPPGSLPPAKKPKVKPSGIENAAKAVIKEAIQNSSLAPPSASDTKPESSQAAPEPVAKPGVSEAKPAVSEAKPANGLGFPDPLDVSGISIPKEDIRDDGVIRIYDNCDTIRQKIRAFLASTRMSRDTFTRLIVKATYGESSTKVIQSVSFSAFLNQTGPLAGNASAVFYAGYAFFEKLRIKRGEAKSEDRLLIEKAHPDGLPTRFTPNRMSYLSGAKSAKEKESQ
ncbi:hypothetical protein QBC34DRAFT_499715 [Podospora aff. communis PSN243]|uniref:DUF7726 domain-containing protein n=1 Tax=Podospora aff. communis PSN243 TaxID=3040156 RepID=A0AAV9G3N3_9PEZI|nr:hypothetical protein QBC34DRAFT_499715 [Podospora aff. communis PSN243]